MMLLGQESIRDVNPLPAVEAEGVNLCQTSLRLHQW
jgi:hypothetical protein